ncbi:MAG: hypothetical protein JWM16_1655 [Verrucomicrobiales bacterium]|nr:hypothetical protein [Verrucomicrobiales bacterium]
MKSIRSRLTLHLLLGLFFLLGSVGALIYFNFRGLLQKQFDAALQGQALAMAGAIKQEGDKLEFEFRDNTKQPLGGTNRTEFYEVRLAGGASLRKSHSLGTINLGCELGSLETPKFSDLGLPGGGKGRAIGVKFTPRYERRGNKEVKVPELSLVVALDRRGLDQAMQSLLLFVLLAGVITLAAAASLVAITLYRGMTPLDQLAGEAERIDAGSLEKRFRIEGLPAELQPISIRLNDLLARLEQSFNEISEYSAKVAHELRTPLTILRLKVEQASDRIPHDIAEELQTSLHHLHHVVDQSLLIARAEQGRLAVEPQPFDLAALVADITTDFSLVADEDGRQVHYQSSGPSWVMADPKHARQIIHNLLSNALKHGRGDIQVMITSLPTECGLTISNWVATHPAPADETLGLGLRVVNSLLALQPGVSCDRQRTDDTYVVHLIFPALTESNLVVPSSTTTG